LDFSWTLSKAFSKSTKPKLVYVVSYLSGKMKCILYSITGLRNGILKKSKATDSENHIFTHSLNIFQYKLKK